VREQIRRFLNWRTAIAELLIVIFGVLIALSVDSWWEERSDRLEEAEHLAALMIETEQNLVELYTSLERLELLSGSTRELINIVEGARDVPPNDVLIELTWLAFSMAQFNPQLTAYENLLSSGNVRLITNDALRMELARFKSQVEGLKLLDMQVDQWNLIIQPWVVENLQLDWLPASYRVESQLPEPKMHTDWNAVIRNQEFKGILISRVVTFDDFKLGLDRIRPSLEALAANLGVDTNAVEQRME